MRGPRTSYPSLGIASSRGPAEEASRARFAQLYAQGLTPVTRSIEQAVCGCDYGGNSWTTRDEAERIAVVLGLRPGVRLLDVGAGTGWPGLYLANNTGCDIALVDLPLAGLRTATARAGRDRLSGACWAVLADGAELPFCDSCFDAVSHSDVLCCLEEKRAVLAECRRILKDGGRMAFSVISVAPGLSDEDHRRAVGSGPAFVEVDEGASYAAFLDRSGWSVLDVQDLTAAFADAVRRQIAADQAHKEALQAQIGFSAYAEREASWQRKLQALGSGLLCRSLFVAAPAR